MSQQTVIAFSGLPGVGKSVASEYTAAQLSLRRYRSDEIRKELFSDPSYSDAEVDATYEELFARAIAELESGSNVVLDATFRDTKHRDRLSAVADANDASVLFVHVTCDPAVVVERIQRREDDPSDADLAVYRELKSAFDPYDRDHVTIDNSGTLEETRRQLDRAVLSDHLQ